MHLSLFLAIIFQVDFILHTRILFLTLFFKKKLSLCLVKAFLYGAIGVSRNDHDVRELHSAFNRSMELCRRYCPRCQCFVSTRARSLNGDRGDNKKAVLM